MHYMSATRLGPVSRYAVPVPVPVSAVDSVRGWLAGGHSSV